MGQSTSKAFHDIFDEPAPSTPAGKRVVSDIFDPRSPTCEVARTPIQVSKTPEKGELYDPRSPTEGIDRTPIYGNIRHRATADIMSTPIDNRLVMADPRSPTDGIDRTPIVPGSDVPVSVGVSMSPGGRIGEEDEREASQESNGDKLPTHYDSQSDLLPSATSSTTPTGKGSKKKKKSKSLFSNGFKIHTSPPKDKNTTPRKNKPNNDKATTPLREQAKASPLSSRNVDYNSPRVIVQRKQTDKLAFIKSSGLTRSSSSPRYQVMQDDKENRN